MAKSRKHNAKGRTEGEPRFVQLPYWVLESPAALALSGSAFKVLVYLLKRHNGVNNGKIAFGARGGCYKREPGTKALVDASIGIGPSATSAALYELERAGFVRCTKASTFDQKRMAREWRLTWLPMDKEPPTNEFTVAVGEFKRPKKQKPVRQSALSPQLQCARAHTARAELAQITPYSAAERTMPEFHSAAGRTHLVTIPSDSDDGETRTSSPSPAPPLNEGKTQTAIFAARVQRTAAVVEPTEDDALPAPLVAGSRP